MLELVIDNLKFNHQTTGNICFRYNSKYFPEQNWNDFPLIVFGWWSDALRLLKKEKRCRFVFMDGPFELNVEIVRDCVRFYGLNNGKKTHFTGTMEYSLFRKVINDGIKEFLTQIDGKLPENQLESAIRLTKSLTFQK